VQSPTATTFDPTAAARPFAGKGKERRARAIVSSQVQPTNRPLPPRTPADRGELVGLACAVREASSGCPFFPRWFVWVERVGTPTQANSRREALGDTGRAR
jgi:hypothetical protein